MPKFKLPGFGEEAAEASGGEFKPYEGPLPPAKTRLRVLVKQLKLKINKNEDPMFNCVAEAAGNEGDKAQYNGLPMWWNGNLTEQGKGFVNDFVRSVAGHTRHDPALVLRKMWAEGPNLDGVPKGKGSSAFVRALGPMAIDDKGMVAEVLTKLGKEKDGKTDKAEVGFWVFPKKQAPVDGEGTADEPVEDEEIEDEADDDGVEDEYAKEPPF